MEVNRKAIIGRVVSDRMKKTVVVAVDNPKRHPIYKKTTRRVTKFKVHDENNECRIGDVVKIIETRPLSKDKRWLISEIVTRGEVVEIAPKDIT